MKNTPHVLGWIWILNDYWIGCSMTRKYEHILDIDRKIAN